jgi:hypothetical protein
MRTWPIVICLLFKCQRMSNEKFDHPLVESVRLCVNRFDAALLEDYQAIDLRHVSTNRR